jgi:hypothetical protein
MENAGNIGRAEGELKELYQEIIDFFHISKAGKFVVSELKNRLNAYQIELDIPTNKREVDLVIKGKIAELNYVLSLPGNYKRKAIIKEKK